MHHTTSHRHCPIGRLHRTVLAICAVAALLAGCARTENDPGKTNSPQAPNFALRVPIGISPAAENGAVSIPFRLADGGQVSAGIFDADGRQARPLLYGVNLEVGEHSLEWDGLDREGNSLPPGDYELRVLRTPGFTAHFVGQLGINPGLPPTDPVYRRNGRQWAGSHGGVTALAADGDGLYLAAATAEFVPIILKQSHDGRRRMWERYEFQPAQGAISLAFGTSPPNSLLHADGILRPVVAGGQGGGTLGRARELADGHAPDNATGFQWHDLNDDGRVQPEEIRFFRRRMPSGMKIQAPVGEGFAYFAGDGAVLRLAPTTWHGPVPEYPDHWEKVAEIAMPPRTAFAGFGFLERGEDLYAAFVCARDRHGPCFPTDRTGKVRLVHFGSDGQPLWSVGRAAVRNPHDLANPSPPGDFHESTGFVGAVRGTVVVTDRSVRPATAWTEDGLYAGDFLDHRADDGLPDSLYRWWRTREGVDAILNFDHEVPGAVVEHQGDVYWFANGWQCVPVYRITGWDGWERHAIPLRLTEPMPAAAAEGTGLLGQYYAKRVQPDTALTDGGEAVESDVLDELSAESDADETPPLTLERVDAQVWFSQGDWYGMQTEVWGAFGPKALGTIDGPLTVRWLGELEAPLSEDFRFSVYADARVRLWLDGRQLVWGWNATQTTRVTPPMRLEAGRRYALRLDIQSDHKAPTASLNWESLSLDRERIPQRYLYPTAPCSAFSNCRRPMARKKFPSISKRRCPASATST